MSEISVSFKFDKLSSPAPYFSDYRCEKEKDPPNL